MSDKNHMRSLMVTILMAGAGLMAQNSQGIINDSGSNVTLSYVWQKGSKLPEPRTVSLRATASSASYTVLLPSDAKWVIASPRNGEMPATLSVSVDPSELAPGTYVSSITVAVEDSTPLFIPIAVTVIPSTATSSTQAAPHSSRQSAAETGRQIVKWGCAFVHCMPLPLPH